MSGDTVLYDSLAFIEDTLLALGISNKLTMRTLLLAEELIPQFLENGTPGSQLRVQIKRSLGNASVLISAPGTQFDPYGPTDTSDTYGQLEDEEAQQAIRSILLRSQGENLKFSCKNGVNQVRILADQSQQSMLVMTAAALVMGLVFGLLMKYVFPSALSYGLNSYFLDPVKTIFMNALKVVIGPGVFFSIVSCISRFKDLSELGRLGAKVTGTYLMTTVMAVLLAIGVFTLLHPGKLGFALSMNSVVGSISVDTDTDMDTSVLQAIIHIVPDNFIKPFLETNTAQLIFLAVLFGIAVGMIGKYSSILLDFFEAFNSLFSTITTILTRIIPIVVFCSVALMIAELGGSALLAVFTAAGTVILAIVCMLLVYGVLIAMLGHLNPITFFRKNREGMITSFSLSSSSAAMPTSMNICTDKLGVSPRVCNFSIPLGAAVNLDGACIMLTICGLFLARLYGVSVSGSALLPLAVTVVVTSMGASGFPGAELICLGVVLESLGVPIAAIGLIMGLNPFLDMFVAMSNTTGDITAAVLVAKSEGLLDLEKYNK